MSIYKNLINEVNKGSKFKIDLIKKDLWINKKQIIKEGEIVYEQWVNENLIEPNDLEDVFEYNPILNEWCWNVAEMLYEKYKNSSPKQIKSCSKSYFKANDYDQLLDRDIAYGLNRNFAQVILEGYILFASLIGWLEWENEDHWFYQGNDKDFVVLKEWVKM